MRGKRHGENDRAQKAGRLAREFWSKRPLSMWSKNSTNKRIARKIERQHLKRQIMETDQ